MQQAQKPYGHPNSASSNHICGGDPNTVYRTAEMQYATPQMYQAQDGTYYYQYGAGEYGAAPVETPAPATGVGSWFEFSNNGYLKGFLIGAGATLLLTNSDIQKALVRGAVKAWSLVQGGVEEVKEQFQDVKAEMSQEE